MTDVVVRADRVSKKFKRGEIYDSLRDLIPAIARTLFGKRNRKELGAQEFWALRDVSFEVGRGEALAIIGSNGAGKSTVLKLLSGIMKPTSGTISRRGRLSALIEIGAGFHPDLTGRENIFLSGAILGMRREEIRAKLDQIVEFSGIETFIDTPVKRYSSGMYARLGFSVAAHVEPDILIVDEVLSVGDYVFQNKCVEKMRSVMACGATVIFVSHNLKAVSDICGRALLLDHGCVAGAGPTNDVIRAYLQQAYGSRDGAAKRDVYISSVGVRNAEGKSVRFRSGEQAWVDIEVRANAPTEKFAVIVVFKDDSQYRAFSVSTERLDGTTFSLRAGDVLRCSYQLELHLASGTFHVCVVLSRHEIGVRYDEWAPATTIYVDSKIGARGVAQLYPKAVYEIVRDPDGSAGS
jgi:ABC-type polysaccharide/polyol phosphate transport system ATPase subunit